MAGSHPREAPALLGIHLHPVSGAQRGDQGSPGRNQSGSAPSPDSQSAADPAAACLHPTPAPLCAWRLLVEGSFLLLGVAGGDPREPPRCPEVVGPGSLGEVTPGREFPPLLESRTSPSPKAPSASTMASGDAPAPSLGTASSPTTPRPPAYSARRPTSRGFYAGSLTLD